MSPVFRGHWHKIPAASLLVSLDDLLGHYPGKRPSLRLLSGAFQGCTCGEQMFNVYEIEKVSGLDPLRRSTRVNAGARAAAE
jgi:hypothetical protein